MAAMSDHYPDVNTRLGFGEDWEVIERHPLSERFHELLVEAGTMHDRKQLDYGTSRDPFANVRAADEWGIAPWIGAMVRLTDKVRRLQSLASKGYLENESAVDSLMDIAVYAIIARVLLEEESRRLAVGPVVRAEEEHERRHDEKER